MSSENITPNINSLKLLFDRPRESLHLGRDGVTLDMPESFLPERYQLITKSLRKELPPTGPRIKVARIAPLDLSQVTTAIDRDENFSIFNPYHRRCAHNLINILMGKETFGEFFSACVFAREKVNPYLFAYATTVAILHRKDTKNADLPSHCKSFPELFFGGNFFSKAISEASIDPSLRGTVEVPQSFKSTASNLDVEHRVAYFREDVGINLHHWHWHLVYPSEEVNNENIVKKDRRGELFYYMHQQIIARYNFERLSNGLARVKRLNNFRSPIPEGYFPKLVNFSTFYVWGSRQPNSNLHDLNRDYKSEPFQVDVQDVERWRDRILDDITGGYLLDTNGNRVTLQNSKGIDLLGNVVEASILSTNSKRYGDLHNTGHVLLAHVHDPDNRFLENMGVMGDNSTAMRDPVFYTWHAYIDDIFQKHKSTLLPYNVEELQFPQIEVQSVEIDVEGGQKNKFETFWEESSIDVSSGLNFQPRGPLFARFSHLQHSPFTYSIGVENKSGEPQSGTVRIFLAPIYDERKEKFSFDIQRLHFIELDKFSVSLKPGYNSIERHSSESSVTIPFDQMFGERENDESKNGDQKFNYCKCGWPEYLLIPKGHVGGLAVVLFVMITNGQLDSVTEPDTAVTNSGCHDATSYCGLRDALYPDRRAMGFPFDRKPRPGVKMLNDFLTTNMRVLETTIQFFDPPPSK